MHATIHESWHNNYFSLYRIRNICEALRHAFCSALQNNAYITDIAIGMYIPYTNLSNRKAGLWSKLIRVEHFQELHENSSIIVGKHVQKS